MRFCDSPGYGAAIHGVSPSHPPELRATAVTASATCTGSSSANSDVASRFGYFDQSHLVRDFARFTGLPPTGWLETEF